MIYALCVRFKSATRALYSWLHQGVGSAYSDFGQVLFHAHLSKGTIVSSITCLSQAAILFINRLLSLIIQTTYIYSCFYTTDPCRAVKREGYTSQSPIYRNALMPLRPSQILPNMLALPEKQFHHLKYFSCHPICVRVQMICAPSLPYRFYEFLTTPTLAGFDDC